jgi:hypothetical protein
MIARSVSEAALEQALEVEGASDGRRWALLALLLLTLLLSLPVLEHPAGRDQGIFAYIGWRWLDGHIPYQDGGVEVKGPGIYLIYALAFRLFGLSFPSVRIADVVWRLLSVAAFFLLLLSVHKRVSIAVWAAGFFYCAVSTLTYSKPWWGAQTESFMELPLILCFLAAFRAFGAQGWRASAWMLASGVACGIATSIKTSGLFPLGALLPYLIIELGHRRLGLAKAMQFLLLFLAGLTLALVPFIVYFAAHGALTDMLDIVWTFNQYNAHQTPFRIFVSVLVALYVGLWNGLRRFDLWYVGALLGALVVTFQSAKTHHRLMLFVWWLTAAYLSVALQGKFFGYHWIVTAAPLSLLAGYGVAWFIERLSPCRSWFKAIGALLLLLGLLLSIYHSNAWQVLVFGRLRLGTANKAEISARMIGGKDYETDILVASYLADHTEPGECLLVWGYEPLIYFLAKRPACTRYIFDYPLTCEYAPSSWLDKTRAIFLSEIQATPPSFIAVAHDDTNPVESQDSATQLAEFQELAQIVARDYCYVGAINNFDLYDRCQKQGMLRSAGVK